MAACANAHAPLTTRALENSVEDVYRRFPAIEDAIKRLSRVPKPLPPKKEKKGKKEDKGENATEADGEEAKEGGDGEDAKGEADGEEKTEEETKSEL
jgi:hypothetical protein